MTQIRVWKRNFGRPTHIKLILVQAYCALSQKVSDDPPGEVTNESETDPVTKHSDQKTNLEESPDEDFVSVKVSVTDTIKKFLVRDSTKKYPKLNRAPTTEMKEKFKSQKPTPRARTEMKEKSKGVT